ncbi:MULTISPECIES: hypothetical protein [unclassified Haloparvum]|uniref:hypothetical protein n=1 Tax=Haloparvum sp. PAK95 TaxID=3418962 RepID=UPI003D2EE30A
MTDERAPLLGSRTAERAFAWSVVGFLLTFYAFPLAELLGIAATEWIALLAVTLPTIGAVAIAEDRRALVPSIVLVYGPFAAALLQIVTPIYVPVPYVEQLLVAAVGAVALGTAAYLVGRSLRLLADQRR